MLAAVAAGGVLGAEARYGLTRAVPHVTGTWPWATLATNVLGCLLIGLLMVVLLEVITPVPVLARPFLGVGVLGGFTTFSTYALDVFSLLRAHRELIALTYLAMSLVACFAAVTAGVVASRWALVRGRR